MQKIFVLLFFLVSTTVLSAERVKWEQGRELPFELKSGVERKVVFPEKVRFGYKQRYSTLFNQSLIDNVFYLTPSVSFNEKLAFQGLESGRFYILHAMVSESASKADVELVVHVQTVESSQTGAASSANTEANNGIGAISYKVSPIDLVQFASQSLYSPSERLIEPKPGIRQVALKQRDVPNLYRGGSLSAKPIASWIGGGLYVTAVKLINTTSSPIVFEPCRVRGDFYSASAQFKHIYGAGHKKGFTVVYLVSEKPFDVAVQKRELLCV